MKFRYIYLIIITIILYILYLNININTKEPFIGHLYRPHIRNINILYKNFMDNYGPNIILSKINKWINY